VRISTTQPTIAEVRWDLAGAEEVRRFRLRLDGNRFSDFSGTGRLEEDGDDLVWTPGGPYAHLRYRARLRHRRHTDSGYDSYATDRWVVTRTQDLFPRTRIAVRKDGPRARSRSRVRFRLPPGWKSVAAMEEIGPGEFRPIHRGGLLDRPTGWLALGDLTIVQRTVGETTIEIVKTPGSGMDAEGLADLYTRALPLFPSLIGALPRSLLVVSAPDPMWRGGLSGEHSLYLHGDRPLRTPDHTSPALHELFHVVASFRPAADARWISEGLAEFYSLELQRRLGAVSGDEFRRGLRLFERYGRWHVDLTAEKSGAVTNNSAPLVMYAIDRSLRRGSDDQRTVDAVVFELSRQAGPVSTAKFLRVVNQVSGRNFTPFFQRHVYAGEPPRWDVAAPDRPSARRAGTGSPP
jgi:hypothetical protein